MILEGTQPDLTLPLKFTMSELWKTNVKLFHAKSITFTFELILSIYQYKTANVWINPKCNFKTEFLQILIQHVIRQVCGMVFKMPDKYDTLNLSIVSVFASEIHDRITSTDTRVKYITAIVNSGIYCMLPTCQQQNVKI